MNDEFIKWRQELQAGDDAMSPDAPAVRQEVAADPTQVIKDAAAIAPPPGQLGDVKPVRRPKDNDHGRRRPTVGKVAIVAVPLLVGALGVGFGLTRNHDSNAQPGTALLQATSTASSTVATSASASPTTASPAPGPSTAATASAKARSSTDPSLEQLQALTQGDARLVATKVDGRFVAMLSSKTAGIVDPLQTTASGSHRFGWSDILSEHERLRNDPRFGSQVFLIMSTAFGDATTYKGKPLFVTAVDNSFFDAADVRSWCDATFAELPKAQRDNTCAPARLTPPA